VDFVGDRFGPVFAGAIDDHCDRAIDGTINSMKVLSSTILLLIVIVLAGAGGYWIGLHHEKNAGEGDDESTTAPTTEEKPVAQVTLAPLKRGTITQTITAYGSVVAQPGEVRILSVPFESRIGHIHLTAGQQVNAGDAAIEVEPSPDALASLEEARIALTAAEKDLKQTQQRFNDRLATNTELSQSQQAVASAKLKVQSLTDRGVGSGKQTLKAPATGIVGKVDVQEGQIVAASSALIEIATSSRIEVSLGVEPSDALELKPGQAVKLRPVDRPTIAPVEGKIRLIGQRIDPTTRLAEVLVTLPQNVHWMLDTYVTAQIEKASAQGLIVPRDAVLADEDGKYALFTATDGHAVKHDVRLGLTTDTEAQVSGDDLKEGDSVIVQGNYELEDGMSVTEQSENETTQRTTSTANKTERDE
jgi:RND family efflux transporter MFP subunit